MVHHTRLDCIVASAGLIRRCVAEALHHTAHREAFGRKLSTSPIMANVLADLAIESEAATVLAFRVAEAFDKVRHLRHCFGGFGDVPISHGFPSANAVPTRVVVQPSTLNFF